MIKSEWAWALAVWGTFVLARPFFKITVVIVRGPNKQLNRKIIQKVTSKWKSNSFFIALQTQIFLKNLLLLGKIKF